MIKVPLSCYIPVKEKDELNVVARAKGISKTQVVRDALQLYYSRERKTSPCPLCGTTIRGRKS